MPDRIIRDELLESERWLTLKDNGDRLAYLALLLKADTLGNFDAAEYRLLRLWRDYGINTTLLVTKTLTELVDHDLVRLYEVDGKRYLHIPRFRQELRYLTRRYPLSPWTTEQQKQALEKLSHHEHDVRTTRSHAEEKRSEKRGSEKKEVPYDAEPETGETWAEHWTAKGKALGITPRPGESTGDYCKRVMATVKSAA